MSSWARPRTARPITINGARISQRLIREKGFSFIAVEGDWPDCYHVNRYVKGLPDSGTDAREVLDDFDRWPTWMWANEEVVALAEWLRRHNDRPGGRTESRFLRAGRVQPLGLAVRGARLSPEGRPEGLPAARRAVRCFQPYGEDVQEYARATALVPTSCEDEVVALLMELRGKEPRYRTDGREEYFAAEQNALVVKDAEAYYRAMVHGGPESWNIRDRHMTETLDRLMRHHGPEREGHRLGAQYPHRRRPRHRDGGRRHGQRGPTGAERHADDGVVLVGFGSHRGSVIAGNEWEAPMEEMEVPPGRQGSWEDVLRRAGESNKLLLLDGVRDDERIPRGARASRHRRGVPPRVRAVRQLRALSIDHYARFAVRCLDPGWRHRPCESAILTCVTVQSSKATATACGARPRAPPNGASGMTSNLTLARPTSIAAEEPTTGGMGSAVARCASFLSEVERGDIPRGSVLIIENLDRLSRENPWDSVRSLCSHIEARPAAHGMTLEACALLTDEPPAKAPDTRQQFTAILVKLLDNARLALNTNGRPAETSTTSPAFTPLVISVKSPSDAPTVTGRTVTLPSGFTSHT